MIGTLVLAVLTAGPVVGVRAAPAQETSEVLRLDFETRIDGRPSRTPPADSRDGRGGRQAAGWGPVLTQQALHPGSGTMTEPPAGNVPPEAGPGPETLRFYVIHIGGYGKGTQTGYWEEFMVYAPAQTKPRPLLVVFHKWGVGWADARDNTEFFQEGMRRRWHVVCQLGASGVHLSSLESQQNTEHALQWVFDNFNVDKNRIYGIGFSMGGGAVANYAARHVDPKDHMFAAIVNHTGMMSHSDTFLNSPSGAQDVFEFWFDDPPDPFKMARSSLIDFDPQTLVVDDQTDVVRNLKHVPIKVMRATSEPLPTAYLTVQNDVFAQHLASLGGSVLQEFIPYSGHSWAMLNEPGVCAWLGNWNLRIPTNGDTLADHDGTYFYFDIEQEAPGAFTPFSWSINETQNKVLIWNTENLQRVSVDLLGAGLSVTQTLHVVLEADDGNADECLLNGWPSTPSEVRREGVVQPIGSTWSYNAVMQQITIQEWEPAIRQWYVDP